MLNLNANILCKKNYNLFLVSTWLFGIAMNMVRNYMRKMIEQDLYELPVLSFQELTQEINIQPLARVEL